MTSLFEGKWSPSHFMDTFLPWPGSKKKTITYARNFSYIFQRGRAGDRNAKLIEALNKPGVCGELAFVKGDQLDRNTDEFRPTICGLYSARAPKPEKEDCYNAVELFIEPTLASQEAPTTEVLARVSTYASKVFNHQHRTHLFSIHIDDNRIRFARWDHAAIIASAVCEFKSKTLAEFLQRFHSLSPQGQGRDNTAQIASSSEKLLLERAIVKFKSEHAERRPAPPAMVEISAEYPTYKLRIAHPDQERAKEYIVQKPFFMRNILIDRGTRGYLAWSISEKRLVFVKDSWAKNRAEIDDCITECTAVRILNNGNIPHVPKFFAFGDVVGEDGKTQTALNQHYAEVCNNDDSLEHYRIAQTLAFPLRSSRRSRDLVSAFRNALCAMEKAHKTVSLYHSDISLGNIMFDCDTWEGMLIDWDSALLVPQTAFASGPGTDPFRSIWSTLSDQHVHRIHDDVESCFWAFLKATLSWCGPYYQARRKFKDDPLNDWYQDLLSGGVQRMTLKKLRLLESPTLSNIQFTNPNLNAVFHAFAEKIRRLYHIPGQTLDGLTAKKALKRLKAYKRKNPKALEPIEQELADVQPIIQIFDEELAKDDWPDSEGPEIPGVYPRFVPPDQWQPRSEATLNPHHGDVAEPAEALEPPRLDQVQEEGRPDKGKKRARPSDDDNGVIQTDTIAEPSVKEGEAPEGRKRRTNVQGRQEVRNLAKKARLQEIEGTGEAPRYEGRMTRSRTRNAGNVP